MPLFFFLPWEVYDSGSKYMDESAWQTWPKNYGLFSVVMDPEFERCRCLPRVKSSCWTDVIKIDPQLTLSGIREDTNCNGEHCMGRTPETDELFLWTVTTICHKSIYVWVVARIAKFSVFIWVNMCYLRFESCLLQLLYFVSNLSIFVCSAVWCPYY